MPTYFIVAENTSPLGPNEIEAGGTIQVNDGDIFIIQADADANTRFEAATGSSTNFEIQFNVSNSNNFEIEIRQDLNPNITIADNVVLSDLKIKADDAESVTLTAGDNVTLDEYDGAKGGVDTIVLGDNFTTNKDFKTENGDDTVTVGTNFTGPKIDTGGGTDTVITRDPNVQIDNAETVLEPDGIVQGTTGDDTMNVGYADSETDTIDGDDGLDDTIIGGFGDDTINGGDGADTIYGDFDTTYTAPPDPASGAEVLTFNITNADVDGNGDVDLEVDQISADVDLANDVTITDGATDPIDFVEISKIGNGDGEEDIFRFDLSTFDDDFVISIKSESAIDKIILQDVIETVDNGDGTFTYTFIGADDQEHTVTTTAGDLAQNEPYQPPLTASDSTNDTIDGGAGDDTIDGGYGDDDLTGGTGADTIYGGIGADTIDGGIGDDIIYGGGGVTEDAGTDGNDIIDGGAGADTIYGGAGDDTITGGTGDDTIRGDDQTGGVAAESEFLDWSAAGADESSLAAGFTQNTGTMDVSVSFTNDGNNTPVYEVESTDTIYVAGGEPFDTNSSLYLWGDGDADTSTTEISFAAASGGGMTDQVENLSFRISDIDSAAGNHQDQVTVTAFDANNNPVTVTLTPAGDDTVSGNTITAGAAGDSQADANGSVLVEIAGPVQRIEIDYNNLDNGTQAIWVSDLHFDTIPSTTAGGGDDDIDAGDGTDTIFASFGTDTIDGGAGTDTYDADELNDGSIDATIDQTGAGSIVKSGDGATDTITGVERFIADEVSGQTDSITLSGTVDPTAVSGLGNDSVGTFTPTGGGSPIAFGPGGPTINDILSGSYDPGSGPISPNGTYTITSGEEDGGQIGNIYVQNFEEITFETICFAAGTRIATAAGEVPVETLAPGDLVQTLDHGLQPVRWVASSRVPATGHLAPVRIAAGALGNHSDLLVSPQHRMLLSGWQVELLFGAAECFAPAKALVDGTAITREEGGWVSYYHVMLDRHEIVFAEGAPSESFHPGAFGVETLAPAARAALFAAFPDLRGGLDRYGPSARMTLKPYEALLLATAGIGVPAPDGALPRLAA